MNVDANSILERRRRYWALGYRPLEVWGAGQLVNDAGEPLNSPGKQPRGRWRENAAKNPPEATRTRPDPRALNTGVLCGQIVGFDIDVLDQQLVDQVAHTIENALGPTPLSRIGRAPKTLLVYRPDRPFTKLQTPEVFFPDGSKAKVEILANGQMFVADGIHPETHQPYRWTDRSPEDMPLADLPAVTEEQARQIIIEAEHLLRAAGAKEKEKPPRQTRKHNGCAGDFFRQVNTAALSGIAIWVRVVFPRARFEPGTGAWRISSKDLNRGLEEDISIHPDGVRDFGEEEPLSPIDIVIQHGGAATPLQAALWLCDKLGIDPAALGYIDAKAQHQHSRTDAEQDQPQADNSDWSGPRLPAQDWPNPLGPAAYHGIVGDIVRLIEPQTESDPAALIFHLLVFCGNAFGRDAYVLVEESRHHANLFAITAGDTSKARKGTSEKWARRVMCQAQPAWERNQTSSGLSTGEGLIERVRDARIEKKFDKKSGTWNEEVIDEGVSDKRLLIVEEELSRLLRVMGRSESTLSSVLRQAWDGIRLAIMTRNRPVEATDPLISLIAHITIAELRAELTDVQAANGFGNRCLFACVKRSKLLPLGGDVNKPELNALADRLGQIMMRHPHGIIVFDLAARDLWIQNYERLSQGGSRLVDHLTARSEAQAIRVALNYALLDGQQEIGLAHLQAALEIIRYSNDSVKFIFGDATGDPIADTILRSLRNNPEGLSRIEINNLFSRNAKASDIATALACLLDHKLATFRRKETGGRPSEIWAAC
jgi:Bifunctional DNA primase/polymerase, N-terminal